MPSIATVATARFEDVTAAAGLAGDRDWPTSAAFADLDNDGDLDLYVCHYLKWNADHPRLCQNRTHTAYTSCDPLESEALPDHVFRNDGGRFTDVTAQAGIVDRDGRGFGVVAVDVDDDNRVDLFVANDRSANYLFRNQGGFRFEEQGLIAGVACNAHGGNQAGMGVAAGDLDGDGRLDLAVTNFFDESTTFFHNLGGGQFADHTSAIGLAAPSRYRLGFGIAFLDVNNDGRLDLMTANGHVNDYRPEVPYAMPVATPDRRTGRTVDRRHGAGRSAVPRPAPRPWARHRRPGQRRASRRPCCRRQRASGLSPQPDGGRPFPDDYAGGNEVEPRRCGLSRGRRGRRIALGRRNDWAAAASCRQATHASISAWAQPPGSIGSRSAGRRARSIRSRTWMPTRAYRLREGNPSLPSIEIERERRSACHECRDLGNQAHGATRDPPKRRDSAFRRGPGGGGLSGGFRLVAAEPPRPAPTSARCRAPSPYANTRSNVRYVGDSACAGCHGKIAETYRRHPMGRSLSPIANATSGGDERAGRPLFEAQGLEYSIENRDGRVLHQETRRDAAGGIIARNEAEVQFVVGSGRQAFAYLIEHDGFLFQSPLTWYEQKQRWDLVPRL